MELVGEDPDPLIAVEKSPAYTVDIQRLFRLRAAFPDARFIHLTRHPVGQCKSVMSLYDGTFALFVNSIDFVDDRAIIEPQFAWHDFNVNILNFLDTVPAAQQMRIRGEDVMNDPPHWLGAICRWLGIRADADALEQMMHPERSPFACFGPLDAMFGNDPNFPVRADVPAAQGQGAAAARPAGAVARGRPGSAARGHRTGPRIRLLDMDTPKRLRRPLEAPPADRRSPRIRGVRLGADTRCVDRPT